MLRTRTGSIPFIITAALVAFPASGSAQVAMDFPTDTAIVSSHSVTIRGEVVPYEAEVGYQPVFEDDGTVLAALHYTYYRRTDVEDTARRPLTVSFNGGPGSGSL